MIRYKLTITKLTNNKIIKKSDHNNNNRINKSIAIERNRIVFVLEN
jgi:hypothetical protein